MTSFETLLTSCDNQIIRLLGFTTYSMRNKDARRKINQGLNEIDIVTVNYTPHTDMLPGSHPHRKYLVCMV